jgi:hypothetical protein
MPEALSPSIQHFSSGAREQWSGGVVYISGVFRLEGSIYVLSIRATGVENLGTYLILLPHQNIIICKSNLCFADTMFCNFPLRLISLLARVLFCCLSSVTASPFTWPHYYWMQVCVGVVGRFVESQRQLVTDQYILAYLFEVDKRVRLHGSATALCDRFCRVLVARCN